jgi:hypothetical protein
MLLRERILELLAHLHDRRHVDFVERGQDGIGRLRLQQAFGHPGPKTGHGHALLRAIAEIHRRCDHLRQDLCRHARGNGSSCSRGRLSRSRHSAQHIALGYATILARSGNRTWSQIVVGHELGCSWHGDARHGSTGGWRCGSGWASRWEWPQTPPQERRHLALPSVSMRAMSCSATTVPPSPTRTSANTPADWAPALRGRPCRSQFRSGSRRPRRPLPASSSTAASWLQPQIRTVAVL